MLTLLQITFHHPQAQSEAAQRAAWDRAHTIAQWPGLHWKLWIAVPEEAVYGGIYLFADGASAQAYLDGPVVANICAIPGISEVKTQLFAVNEALSAVTRGPMGK